MTHTLDPVKPMNIHNIRIDGNTQSRVSINQTAVLDYSNALSDGDALPPVTVFFDGVDYWLADGFHRYHAYLNIGRASIPAKIKKGTQRDAIMFGFSANNDHGLRPTTEDKAKSVRAMLNDPEWSEMSDRAIARIAGCSHPTVAKMRIPEATKPIATGKFTTQEPESTGKFTTQTANQPSKTEAEKISEDAHGDDDPIAMLEASEAEIKNLRSIISAAEADDKQAEIIKYKRIADVATRRQNELMDTVNAREKELQRQANLLRRIGNALGEDDFSKLPAMVESMVRAMKVEA